ncbi:lycopene cyclase family protein [Modestobacter sp. I12A-02662]|uniref:lycopene cyclase family protein n=1 Tax=Modestobacter sp. I12A-02662 TaxID=1730496 RepID=UPI0034E04AAC
MQPGRPPALDVVVAGAGPAGLSAAAACAAAGLRTALVAPALRPWPHTYCLWAEELTAAAGALGIDPGAVAAVHPTVVVRTAAGGEQRLGRRYARLRNDVLHAALLDRAREHGARLVDGRVDDLRAEGGGEVAVLGDGTELRAGAVLDARGAGPGTAQQRAWGEVVAGPVDSLVPPGSALLMDWTALAGGGPPAFLYGLPLDDGTTLLEATSLAGRPPVPLADLRARLAVLLGSAGLRPVGRPERVAIPLDARPRRAGPGTPLGAAAGMVHPATGYSVGASLQLGPRVAAVLAAGGGAGAARRAVLTARRRATAGLLGVGLEVLLPLDAAATDAFFAAFFTLPEGSWGAYLSTESAPGEVAAAMSRTLAVLPAAQRRSLLRTVARLGGAGAAGRLRALTGRPGRS